MEVSLPPGRAVLPSCRASRSDPPFSRTSTYAALQLGNTARPGGRGGQPGFAALPVTERMNPGGQEALLILTTRSIGNAANRHPENDRGGAGHS